MKALKTIMALALIVIGAMAFSILAPHEAGAVTAMALTGFVRVCGFQSGGVKRIYLAEAADVTSFTKAVVPGEDYTTATMETGKYFIEYQFEPDSFELKEAPAFENNCMKVTHSIEFFMSKMAAGTRKAVSELCAASACGMIAIVEDNNGNKWVVGYSDNMLKSRPLKVKGAAGSSGKKLTDANGYTPSLECEDNEMMRLFSGTVPLAPEGD